MIAKLWAASKETQPAAQPAQSPDATGIVCVTVFIWSHVHLQSLSLSRIISAIGSGIP